MGPSKNPIGESSTSSGSLTILSGMPFPTSTVQSSVENWEVFGAGEKDHVSTGERVDGGVDVGQGHSRGYSCSSAGCRTLGRTSFSRGR